MSMAPAVHPDEPSDRSSPETSVSDKENPQQNRKRAGTQSMASQATSKRQRLANRTSNIQSTESRFPSSQADPNKKYYDPDQDEVERRWLRKGLRDLSRDLNDSRTEYLRAGNTGLRDTLHKANEYFDHVKQTSDATIDSRLLVNAADLSYKKTTALAVGDATAGIDVDEFVSKCITFMRGAPADSQEPPSSTQRRRPHASQANPDGSDDDDQGDPMNWDWLGRTACVPHNARPAVTGFLLGPLSVQKRTRKHVQRTARERLDSSKVVKPAELEDKDLDRQETSNLTTICASINKLLAKAQQQSQDKVDQILSQMDEEPSEEMIHDVMDQYDVADDGGMPLFRFCINPRSFGQSVENLFYVSFLVRDGTVGISFDSNDLPTLHAAKPYAPSEAQRKKIQKHQAVFSLDFDTWQSIIDQYEGKDCIIPHRQEDMQETRRGWYG